MAGERPTVASNLGRRTCTSPFLSYNVESVVHATENHAGRKLDSPAKVFAVARE
jgi:hypothetical protein